MTELTLTVESGLARFADASVCSLRALLRSPRASLGPAAAAALASAEALVDVLGTAGLRSAVSHPLYRHWRVRLMALVGQEDHTAAEDWVRHLPRLLIGHLAQREDRLPSVTVPVTEQGWLHLPGLPWHLELGAGPPSEAVIQRDAGTFLIQHRGRTHVIPARAATGAAGLVVSHPVLGQLGIEMCNSDPWIRQLLDEANDGKDSPSGHRRDVAPAALDETVSALFTRAAAVIERSWPQYAAAMAAHVRLVVPITSDLLAGWTSLASLGAIYVRARPGGPNADRYTAERLVHESAHTLLYLTAFGNPLFTDDGADERMRSPLRRDARPAIGVFHATYVLAMVLEFMRRAAVETGDQAYEARARECAEGLTAGAEALKDARLSSFGRDLLDQVLAGLGSAR